VQALTRDTAASANGTDCESEFAEPDSNRTGCGGTSTGMIVPLFFRAGTKKAGDVGFLAGHAISPGGFYHAWSREVEGGVP
jgi:hypothetical protein